MEIEVDQLAKAVMRELALYSESVTNRAKKVVDNVGKEAAQKLREVSPRRTGLYARNWTCTTQTDNYRGRRTTVHNRKHYQLTHLLEKGHVLKRGGRRLGFVSPRAHIAPIEQEAIEKLEKGIREAVENEI